MFCLRSYALLGIAGYADPRWGTVTAGQCGPWGGAGEDLLCATLYGTAGRRPNRGWWPRAAADAARHNVTKSHRPRTYRDAGRERASAAAGRSMRQAGASTSTRHWPCTRIESRASNGPEEEYYLGTITRTSERRSKGFPSNSNLRSRISIIDCNSYDSI
jgi:hypothetical protein